MGRLGDLARAQQPVLRDLEAASASLDTFLTRLRPFADRRHAGLRVARRRLGRGPPRRARERTGDPASCACLASDAPGLAKPLRQFLQTIDQRDRAVEPDARAAATDPPAPDKTHIASGSGGFTGMEAIWNYFYWQALGTNALDDVGHVLRLGVIDPTSCVAYANNAEPPTSCETATSSSARRSRA